MSQAGDAADDSGVVSTFVEVAPSERIVTEEVCDKVSVRAA